jgi:hypothetical protein
VAKFSGTLQEVELGSWRAGGLLSFGKSGNAFDTVCKPRMFLNEVAGQAWLEGWALRHNAGEVAISVERLGDPAPV